MQDSERYLLLALSLLVTRQRRLARGDGELDFIRSLRDPVLFQFRHERDAFRCSLDGRRAEQFYASVLVIESADFVSPVTDLRAHVRLVQVGNGVPAEIKISPELVQWLALAPEDSMYAVYSPLHALYSAEAGFFFPQREPWHAYLARCINSRGGGTLAAREEGGACLLNYDSPTLNVALRLSATGFDLLASSNGSAGLLDDLKKFCASERMPEGVTARLDTGGRVRIRGGAV